MDHDIHPCSNAASTDSTDNTRNHKLGRIVFQLILRRASELSISPLPVKHLHRPYSSDALGNARPSKVSLISSCSDIAVLHDAGSRNATFLPQI